MFPVEFCLFFPRRQAAVWSFQSNLFYIYDTTLLCWHRVWSSNFLEWNLQSLFFSIFHIRQCLVSCATSQFLYQGKFKSKIIFLILTLKRFYFLWSLLGSTGLKLDLQWNFLQAKSANWKFLNFMSQLLSCASDERLNMKD